jgi:hypothetical protein
MKASILDVAAVVAGVDEDGKAPVRSRISVTSASVRIDMSFYLSHIGDATTGDILARMQKDLRANLVKRGIDIVIQQVDVDLAHLSENSMFMFLEYFIVGIAVLLICVLAKTASNRSRIRARIVS